MDEGALKTIASISAAEYVAVKGSIKLLAVAAILRGRERTRSTRGTRGGFGMEPCGFVVELEGGE